MINYNTLNYYCRHKTKLNNLLLPYIQEQINIELYPINGNSNIKQNNNGKINYDLYESQSYFPKPNLNMLNIHKIYIIVGNSVLNEGYTFKKVLQSYNIKCEVINLNKEDISYELYKEVLDNNDRIIIAIGAININNAKILHNLNQLYEYIRMIEGYYLTYLAILLLI